MSLEKKRKQIELMRVTVAKQEMELRIEERMEEVKRLEENIKIQNTKIEELNNDINQMS